ncbi:hypothetical protein GKR75_08035 [Providencia sp. wls1919]|nr:hypothetical protein [Providencia sp. wls1919]
MVSAFNFNVNEGNDFLQNILINIPSGIFVYDDKGVIHYKNNVHKYQFLKVSNDDLYLISEVISNFDEDIQYMIRKSEIELHMIKEDFIGLELPWKDKSYFLFNISMFVIGKSNYYIMKFDYLNPIISNHSIDNIYTKPVAQALMVKEEFILSKSKLLAITLYGLGYTNKKIAMLLGLKETYIRKIITIYHKESSLKTKAELTTSLLNNRFINYFISISCQLF